MLPWQCVERFPTLALGCEVASMYHGVQPDHILQWVRGQRQVQLQRLRSGNVNVLIYMNKTNDFVINP